MNFMNSKVGIKTLLNSYPDSIGNNLGDIVSILKKDEMKGAFDSYYILPSVYNTDLDRGFSLISYDLSEKYASQQAIDDLKEMNINLCMDFILNHISVLSPQFQDLIRNGENSKYRDFFIDWNKFWDGCGDKCEDGYIIPREEYLKKMFFRKYSY